MDSKIPSPEKVDIIYYVGEVNYSGYAQISQLLDQYRTPGAERAYFFPITPGGDPNAGFRIARALGHHYADDLIFAIIGQCKSAGTLMAIGAKELVIADRGELGPLDIQIKNKDELFESSSGLDIIQALAAIQEMVKDSFREYLLDINAGSGVSTKLSSELASEMATGLVAPLTSQIDPIKLGEHQRAMSIATAYGIRLNRKFGNTTEENINRLLAGYPSHGFVIDRKEASDLFFKVRAPDKSEEGIIDLALRKANGKGLNPRNQTATCGVYNLKWLMDEFSKDVQNEVGSDGERENEGQPGSKTTRSGKKIPERKQRAKRRTKKS